VTNPELSPHPADPDEADREAAAPSRRSPVAWILATLVVLGLIGWLGARVKVALEARQALAAERNEATKPGAHPSESGPAKIVTGVAQKWQPEVALEGTLEPEREADLGFRVPGRLAAIRVKLGERVRSGQVLATLDEAEARAQVQAASAQVRAAEAQLALASDAAHRTGKLVGSGAASQASGVQVSEQARLAAAQLDAARAQLTLAETALANHVLTAPFSGAVTRVPPGTGAIVSPGVPLFHLQDTSTLKLAATASEVDAALLHPGVTVALSGAAPQKTGTLVAVLSSVDPSTRRVVVQAEVKNDGPAPLRGGVFVRAEVVGLAPVQVVRVPAEALRPGSQDELMVVKDGRLHARHVLFSRAADGALLVRSGLEATDAILLSPSAEAADGDPAPSAGAAR
jgi:RND family efflux transporter MFP subunit